jgi:hypothetical protein
VRKLREGNMDTYYRPIVTPLVASKRYKQVACFLTPEQHRGLKRLSEETHIPMQVFLRRTVDEALVRYGVKPKAYSDAFLDHRLIKLRMRAK